MAAAATTPAAAATDPGAAPATADDPEVAELKEQLADAEKDADLGKRELALQQDSYLSNPDHEHDSAGKFKVDQLQQQIVDKQRDIDRLKTRLAAAQELHETPAAPPSRLLRRRKHRRRRRSASESASRFRTSLTAVRAPQKIRLFSSSQNLSFHTRKPTTISSSVSA